MTAPSICAFTSICAEDACWIPQYLAETERLGIPFAVHLDRFDPAAARELITHKLCVGYTYKTGAEFTEMHKQAVFDLVVMRGYNWAMAWDIDETFERYAADKIADIIRSDAPYIDIVWHNLWNDERHIRIDGPFQSGHRVKFYNLKHRWKFDHPITNGAKMLNDRGQIVSGNPQSERHYRRDLVCLHHGMMTRALREQHKARWDRIYTAAVGNNPYGFWAYALDEDTYPPIIMEHSYR